MLLGCIKRWNDQRVSGLDVYQQQSHNPAEARPHKRFMEEVDTMANWFYRFINSCYWARFMSVVM